MFSTESKIITATIWVFLIFLHIFTDLTYDGAFPTAAVADQRYRIARFHVEI